MRTLIQRSASTLTGSGSGWHLPHCSSKWVSVNFPLNTSNSYESGDEDEDEDEEDDMNHNISYDVMLCYVMLLCYAMLCYAMLCYAMLCYVMFCSVMLLKAS